METTGIGLVCYSKSVGNKNTEGLKRDTNVLKRQRRRQTELNAAKMERRARGRQIWQGRRENIKECSKSLSD